MAVDFDMEYVKGNSIQHMDVLSSLKFYIESNENTDKKFEYKFKMENWKEQIG